MNVRDCLQDPRTALPPTGKSSATAATEAAAAFSSGWARRGRHRGEPAPSNPSVGCALASVGSSSSSESQYQIRRFSPSSALSAPSSCGAMFSRVARLQRCPPASVVSRRARHSASSWRTGWSSSPACSAHSAFGLVVDDGLEQPVGACVRPTRHAPRRTARGRWSVPAGTGPPSYRRRSSRSRLASGSVSNPLAVRVVAVVDLRLDRLSGLVLEENPDAAGRGHVGLQAVHEQVLCEPLHGGQASRRRCSGRCSASRHASRDHRVDGGVRPDRAADESCDRRKNGNALERPRW